MEIKFYEIIGVKYFKKFLMWLEAKLIPEPEYRKVANYNLKSNNLTAVKQFKKMLILNGTIHFIVGIYTIVCIGINILNERFFSFSSIVFAICFLLNLYCILLQRYNWLRIAKVLNKKKNMEKKGD